MDTRMVVKHLELSLLQVRSLLCCYHLLELYYCIKNPLKRVLITYIVMNVLVRSYVIIISSIFQY